MNILMAVSKQRSHELHMFHKKMINSKWFRFEIDFVKVSDAAEAKEYGIDSLPAVLYFENKIPSVYDEDLNNENELLEWLVITQLTWISNKVNLCKN